MKNYLYGLLLFLFLVIVVTFFVRGQDWLGCTVAASDLGRKTEFSWLSGKCMVYRANGEKVYLSQIRDSSDAGE